MSLSDRILGFYERVLLQHNLESVAIEVERFASEILGCGNLRVELGWDGPNDGPTFIPLHAVDGSLVARLVSDRPVGHFQSQQCAVFLKMAAWAIRRTHLLRAARENSELLNSLQSARTIVEEGLPKGSLKHSHWQVSGELQPAFHVGGDCYSYMVSEDALCFLVLDAVGHGLGSAVLAAGCRALWRGVAFETDLGLAVTRLNRRLFEDTGPERFVAATLGYCYPDGSVEYVTCGQSPLFHISKQGVKILPFCDPPLGLFADQLFEVQKVQLEAGESLLCVTDGVLEWANSAGEFFGEEGVAQALSQDTSDSREMTLAILRSLADFHYRANPGDDVCLLALRRLPSG